MASDMHVLHVINSLQTGGAERLLTELFPHLRAYGVRCSVLSIEPASTVFGEHLRRHGIEVHSLDAVHAYSPYGAIKAIRFLSEYSCDIVHAHLYPAQLWAAIAKVGRPAHWKHLVLTEHNTENWRRPMPLLRPLERWMYDKFDAVACISKAANDALRKSVPGTYLTKVIPNGVDASRFLLNADSDLGEISTCPSFGILSAGRLVEPKGYKYLIEAVPYLNEQIQVSICGEGPLRRSLQRRASELEVGHRVHFLGTRSDIVDLMHGAILYVQPSVYDGFGIAALEAMACGLPVVHSGCAGLADVVGDGGMPADVRNPRAFASVLSTLIADADLRGRLADRARARANEYSIERTARQYLELYQGVMEREVASFVAA